MDRKGLTPARTHGRNGFSRASGGDFRNFRLRRSTDVELLAEFTIHLGEDVAIFFQEVSRVFTPLADALAVVAIPGARLLDEVVRDSKIEHIAFAADALAIQNVELGLAEGSGHLVLHDLDLGAVAGHGISIFNGRD